LCGDLEGCGFDGLAPLGARGCGPSRRRIAVSNVMNHNAHSLSGRVLAALPELLRKSAPVLRQRGRGLLARGNAVRSLPPLPTRHLAIQRVWIGPAELAALALAFHDRGRELIGPLGEALADAPVGPVCGVAAIERYAFLSVGQRHHHVRQRLVPDRPGLRDEAGAGESGSDLSAVRRGEGEAHHCPSGVMTWMRLGWTRSASSESGSMRS